MATAFEYKRVKFKLSGHRFRGTPRNMIFFRMPLGVLLIVIRKAKAK